MRCFLRAVLFSSLATVGACGEKATSGGASPPSVSEALVSVAENGSARERGTALYLLAELEGGADEIARVERRCVGVESNTERLLCAYWAYRRLQSADAARDYVRHFPADAESVAALFDEALAVPMPAGLIDLLRNLATTDPAARAALSSAQEAADGWVAESMSAALESLGPEQGRTPERGS